jgi:hypothetical protein
MTYYQIVRQFIRSLRNLDAILGKAMAHAEERKFDVNNLFSARLFPDMLPFAAQIRIACDAAKTAAAGLTGKEAPRHEDNETTFVDLRGRIAKCVTYLETLTAEDFARTTPDMVIQIPRPPGKGLVADEFALGRQLPNFYFHVVTAYNLLRQGGVPIGKADYFGPLDLRDL